MKLGLKMLLIVVIVTVLVQLIQYPLVTSPILGQYERLELDRMTRNIVRIQEIMKEDLSKLDSTSRDWAHWDDTYSFVKGQDEGYIESNMLFEVLSPLDIDYIAFYSLNRSLVYGAYVDSGQGSLSPLPDWWHGSVSPLAGSAVAENGLMNAMGKSVYIGKREILMSDMTGEPAGWLILGKDVEADRLMRIAQVEDIIVGPGFMIEDEKGLCSVAELRQTGSSSHLHEKMVHGCFLAEDTRGEKSIQVNIIIKDEIYENGKDSIRRMMLGLQLISWSVAVIAFMLIWKRMLIDRLKKMSNELDDIGKRNDLAGRISITGKDEIGILASRINSMLDSLERSVHKEKVLTSMMPDTYVWLDGKGMISDVSYGDSIGILQKNSIGRHYADAIVPAVAKVLGRLLNNMHIDGGTVSQDVTIVNDRRSYVIEIRLASISSDRILAVLRDISERAKSRQELEKSVKNLETTKTAMLNIMEDIKEANNNLKDLDKAKGNFLNIVSHELKTPLTAMLAHIELLSDVHNLTKEQVTSIDAVVRNAHQLRMLIENILEISRIEAGKFELNPTEFDMSVLIRDISDNLGVLAKKKGLSVEIDVPKKMIVNADEIRISEIMNNLINNAIKFTEKGTITVKGRVQKDKAEVSVSDTGIGIPEAQQSKLFTKFFQVDATLSRKFGGTGLGLSITKQLVELHGGVISVSSAVGKGTTFTFRIPVMRGKS